MTDAPLKARERAEAIEAEQFAEAPADSRAFVEAHMAGFRSGWEARQAWVADIEWSNMSSRGDFIPASTEAWAWRHCLATDAPVFWRYEGDPLWHAASARGEASRDERSDA